MQELKVSGNTVLLNGVYKIEFDSEQEALDFVLEMIKNGIGEGRF